MKQIEELKLLYEISCCLNKYYLDLEKSLYNVLKILSDSMKMIRGSISILKKKQNEIKIEVAHGLSERAMEKGKYKPGEGIIGKVIQTGKPIAIEKIKDEPLFLNRTSSRDKLNKEDISFICVPIMNGSVVIGALNVDRIFDTKYSLKQGKRFLTIVSTMIARHVINLDAIYSEREKLKNENKRLQNELHQKYRFNNIIGNSNKMREVFQMISKVSKGNTTVLIRGESGTGKELVANAIHYNSLRSQKPFIKLNCAAIPSTLIESELFGYEKGAFTNAYKQKQGKFEVANKGTIFLDEIGSIDLAVQVKLLRILQEKEFERIGGNFTIKSDVRVIAATNKNLEKSCDDGSFRKDLYYRLNVFPIYIPPLRERKTDILLLADFFLEKYALDNNKTIKRISSPAIDMLISYHWPGNVRELENCIERAVILCNEKVIHSYHLPPTLQTGLESDTLTFISMEEAVKNFEKDFIVDALKNTKGNFTNACKMLDTTLRKLTYKAQKYNINYKDYR